MMEQLLQQVHTSIAYVHVGLQKFTWFFNVSEAECGGDSGDRVKGEGEEDGDSKPRRVQHTD